jgi:hypothetical protein
LAPRFSHTYFFHLKSQPPNLIQLKQISLAQRIPPAKGLRNLSGQGGLFDRKGVCGFETGDFLHDGNAGFAEDVGDLRFAQPGCVVFEREVLLFFVDAEAADAVGVGEFAEAPELIEAGRRVQFVGDFEKCHAGIIPVAAPNRAAVRWMNSLQSTAKQIPHPQKARVRDDWIWVKTRVRDDTQWARRKREPGRLTDDRLRGYKYP